MLGMKMSPEKMQKIMQKMGMKMTEIDAEEVIIKTKTKRIIINNPEVVLADIMGRDVYQVSGNVKEERVGPSEEDVQLVMEQTNASKEEVEIKLAELDNDLAKTIMELKRKRE